MMTMTTTTTTAMGDAIWQIENTHIVDVVVGYEFLVPPSVCSNVAKCTSADSNALSTLVTWEGLKTEDVCSRNS